MPRSAALPLAARRPAAPPRRRRRRTARRCRGPSSRGCARRSRRRSPARVRAWPARMKLSAIGERIDEAGADRLHVEGGAARSCRARLHLGGGGGKGVVGRRGGQHDQVDLVGRRCRPPSSAARAAAIARSEVSLARRRRYGAGGCRCAATIHSSEVSSRVGQLGVGDDPLAADRRRSRRPASGRPCQSAADLRACRGCRRGRQRAKLVADLVEEAVGRHVDGDADGVGEAERVGAAMALHRDAVEAEEDGAVVAPRDRARSRSLFSARRAKQIADARESANAGRPRAGSRHRACAVPSAVFSATLPVKPSVTTTSTVPAAMSSPSTKPWKLQRRAGVAQAAPRLAHRVVALQLLGADIEQPDGRLQQAQHGAGEDVAHQRELHQVVGVALDIGAEIEHHALAAPRREEGGDRRPVDARQRLAARTSPSPSARRYCRPRPRSRPRPSATASIASRMLEPRPGAQRRRRLGVAGDDLVGVVDGGARLAAAAAWRAAAGSGSRRRTAGTATCGKRCSAMFAPFTTMSGAWSPPMASSAMTIRSAHRRWRSPGQTRSRASRPRPRPLRGRRNGRRRRRHDAAASARRNSGIRHSCWRFSAWCGAAHVAARLRGLLLRNGHGNELYKLGGRPAKGRW